MRTLNPIDASPLFLLGMPRSGTTWLSQILESHPDVCLRFSPNYSYPLKNSIDVDATTEQWLTHLKAARESNDEFMTHAYRRTTGELPTWNKRSDLCRLFCIKDTRFHEAYWTALDRLSGAKIIYLVRDPRTAIASWWQCKEFPACDVLEDAWWNGGSRKQEGPGEYWGVADWCELTLQYQKLAVQWPGRVMVVRYESLLDDAESVAQSLFSFAGLKMHQQVRKFLDSAATQSSDSPYSVFRGGRTGDRTDCLPANVLLGIESKVRQAGLSEFLSP